MGDSIRFSGSATGYELFTGRKSSWHQIAYCATNLLIFTYPSPESVQPDLPRLSLSLDGSRDAASLPGRALVISKESSLLKHFFP
jgi:hypothetical protein